MEVVTFSTSPAKVQELRTLFTKMDTDHSRTLLMDEFKHAMALHSEISGPKVETMFADMDISNSGVIDYTKCIAAANSNAGANDQLSITVAFTHAFTMLDRDGSTARAPRSIGWSCSATLRRPISTACSTPRLAPRAVSYRDLASVQNDGAESLQERRSQWIKVT